MKMNFIIYAYRYNDDSGGTVVLHKLCHLLNVMGYEAKLWPNYKPAKGSRFYFSKIFKYFRKSLHRKFAINPSWNTPLAKDSDIIDTSIIVYPEIVDGNPLNAKNIVRWLLHKPGFHTKSRVNYTKNELVFFYLKSYIDTSLQVDLDNELYIPNNREDTYYQINFGPRIGSCYILRKGKDRNIVHDISNSVLIDGKSHEEIAKIFNEVEYCISYDTYTMYSVYAAMCGCKSVVIPEERVSKNEWHPDETQCYGIAYGFEDVAKAEETKKYLFARFTTEQAQTTQQVHQFVLKCKDNFI